MSTLGSTTLGSTALGGGLASLTGTSTSLDQFAIFEDAEYMDGIIDERMAEDYPFSTDIALDMMAHLSTLYEFLTDGPIAPTQEQTVEGHNHGRDGRSVHIERSCGLYFPPLYEFNISVATDYDVDYAKFQVIRQGIISPSGTLAFNFNDILTTKCIFRCTNDIEKIILPPMIGYTSVLGDVGQAKAYLYTVDPQTGTFTEIDSDESATFPFNPTPLAGQVINFTFDVPAEDTNYDRLLAIDITYKVIAPGVGVGLRPFSQWYGDTTSGPNISTYGRLDK